MERAQAQHRTQPQDSLASLPLPRRAMIGNTVAHAAMVQQLTSGSPGSTISSPELRSTMVDDTNIVKVPANQGFPNMSDTGIHNSVFEAFIAADKAMKELPAIREAKDKLERDHLALFDNYNKTVDQVNARQRTIEELEAKLSAREAELARATFRADTVEAKHRALRGILGGDDSPSVAVDGALSQDDPTPPPGKSTLTASDLDHPSSPEPTPAPSSEFVTGSQTAGQSDADPTHTEKGEEWKSEEWYYPGELAARESYLKQSLVEGQSANNPTPNASAYTPSTTAAQSADGATDTTPADGSTTSNADGLAGSEGSPPLPYSGRLYTSKPDGMEWGYWIVNGGEAPYWYDAHAIADAKLQYAPWAGHAKAAE